jgi:hypothetical protein
VFLGCDRQSAFLEQCEVSDDENGEILDETMEAKSSNKMLSTDSSSICDKANDSLMEASEVHECAFCRSEVLSLPSFLNNKLAPLKTCFKGEVILEVRVEGDALLE